VLVFGVQVNLGIKSMLALVGIGAGLTWLYFRHEAEIAALTPTQKAAEVGAAIVVAAEALRARGVPVPPLPGASGLVRAKVLAGEPLKIDLVVEDSRYPGVTSIVKGFPRTAVEGVVT
jgi:hypothetical protein